MKKIIIIACCLLLNACSTKPYTDEEKQLIVKVEQMIEHLQQKQYDEIAKEFSILAKNPQDDIASIIKEGWESTSAEYGTFLGIDRYIFLHLKSGCEVKVIVNYEHYKAQFSINFLSNGKIAGFFFK